MLKLISFESIERSNSVSEIRFRHVNVKLGSLGLILYLFKHLLRVCVSCHEIRPGGRCPILLAHSPCNIELLCEILCVGGLEILEYGIKGICGSVYFFCVITVNKILCRCELSVNISILPALGRIIKLVQRLSSLDLLDKERSVGSLHEIRDRLSKSFRRFVDLCLNLAVISDVYSVFELSLKILPTCLSILLFDL